MPVLQQDFQEAERFGSAHGIEQLPVQDPVHAGLRQRPHLGLRRLPGSQWPLRGWDGSDRFEQEAGFVLVERVLWGGRE